eukprot:4553888-Ditylum_brightwellii.AAC.2
MEDDLPIHHTVLVPSVTWSRQISHLPQYIVDNCQYNGESGNMKFKIKPTSVEDNFYECMYELNEISCLSVDQIDPTIATEMGFVGLATGKLKHTSQMHIMNYEEVMATYEAEEWDKSVVMERNTSL